MDLNLKFKHQTELKFYGVSWWIWRQHLSLLLHSPYFTTSFRSLDLNTINLKIWRSNCVIIMRQSLNSNHNTKIWTMTCMYNLNSLRVIHKTKKNEGKQTKNLFQKNASIGNFNTRYSSLCVRASILESLFFKTKV